jgi:hypothetical protein
MGPPVGPCTADAKSVQYVRLRETRLVALRRLGRPLGVDREKTCPLSDRRLHVDFAWISGINWKRYSSALKPGVLLHRRHGDHPHPLPSPTGVGEGRSGVILRRALLRAWGATQGFLLRVCLGLFCAGRWREAERRGRNRTGVHGCAVRARDTEISALGNFRPKCRVATSIGLHLFHMTALFVCLKARRQSRAYPGATPP